MSKLPIPIYDRLLLKVEDPEEISAGGVILVKDPSEEEDILRGEVLASGEGRRSETGDLIPMTVKVGQTVAFDKEHAATIKVAGIEYCLLDESSVYAILP